MRAREISRATAPRERGSTLYIVAASLVALLLLGGLAIDLGWFYVGRTEAQRAADAAALAGAQQFVESTFTTGGISQTAVTTLADNAAVSTAELNKVGGQTLVAADITAGPPDFSRAGNPLITVQVSKALPTFFMKVFGRTTITVGATATAEAYDPGSTGTGPTFCASCLKPFLVPNCDPDHPVGGSSASANSQCETVSGKTCTSTSADCQSYFLNSAGTPVNSGVYPAGVVGETWTLHTNAAPSQWYEIAFDGSQSGANFANDVEKCNTNQINCGTQLQTLDGKKVGPNDQAICDLITYSTGKCKGAQSATSVDSVSFNASSSPPYTITAGSGNPYFASGTQIGQSASMITVPVYNGANLSSGGSTVTVVGYLQMFVTGFNHSGNDDTISALILGVSSCGIQGGAACGSTGGGTVSGGGASFIPVRLVQHP